MHGVKHLPTMVCHAQINGRAEQYNKRVLISRHYFVAEHQNNCEAFVQSLTSAFSTQSFSGTNKNLYNTDTTRPSLQFTLFCANNVVPTNSYRGTSLQLLHLRLKTTICILSAIVNSHRNKKEATIYVQLESLRRCYSSL